MVPHNGPNIGGREFGLKDCAASRLFKFTPSPTFSLSCYCSSSSKDFALVVQIDNNEVTITVITVLLLNIPFLGRPFHFLLQSFKHRTQFY